MRRLAVFTALLATAALLSCGGTGAGPACTDGIDNDNDGLFDSADPGCAWNDGQSESPDPSDCTDGIDNDLDGMIDADDWACQVDGWTSEVEPEGDCNDGLDNDGDFLADYPQDPGCDSPVDSDETNPPQCGDGVDNDGDGASDYPNDPGCESAEDDDETDPDPLPACGDGADDDNDGVTDYPQDPGCTSAADDSELDDCVTGAPVSAHRGGRIDGSTVDQPARLTAPQGCELSGSSAIAAEQVFGFELDRDLDELVFDTAGSEVDTVLYVRVDDCAAPGTLAMCDDDSLGTASEVRVDTPSRGTYYVIVDGKSNFGGAYRLNISGTIAMGDDCTAGDADFVCADGLHCQGGSCVAD